MGNFGEFPPKAEDGDRGAGRNHVGGVPANCGSGEQVGAGLGINRIARKRLNGLESHPALD